MKRSIVLLHLPGSSLAPRIAARLEEAGHAVSLGSLDAPLEGAAVSVRDGVVTWQGAELLEAGAVWIEAPLFPWPQSLPIPDPLPAGLTPPDWITRQREARALAASALFCAAESRPVINHPASAHLAASPAIALDRWAAAGLPVHPWRLGPAPALVEGSRGGEPKPLVLDAAGRDRWHAPAQPAPGSGDSALILEAFEGPIETLLVVGGRIAARRLHDQAAWLRARSAGEGTPDALADGGGAGASGAAVAEDSALAVTAAAALGLEMAAVSLLPGALLFCEAAPDLAAWDAAAPGRVAAAIVELLAARAPGAGPAAGSRAAPAAGLSAGEDPGRSSPTPKGASS